MPFVIDDIALAATEAAVEAAVEAGAEAVEAGAETVEAGAETASSGSEILGDGLSEDAISEKGIVETVEKPNTMSKSNLDIIGDGLGENSLENNTSELSQPSDSMPESNSDIIKDGFGESALDKSVEGKMLPREIEQENVAAENISENNDNDSKEDAKDATDTLEKDDAPRKIKTINDSLEGQNHPETGVPYENKVVETDTGEKVEGVFPQFESKFDAQLPEELEQATDKMQFDECNRLLKERCDSDPEFKSQFDSDQQADIDEGRTPEGYTWHHSEEKGKMQLVDSDIHWETRHTGGRYIWGGGSENRKQL